jgi:catechol 2,3-dioxygenase-like lactoylglutathione lyase family enzyme
VAEIELLSTIPVLNVSDMQDSVALYRDQLGFAVEFEMTDPPYAGVRRGEMARHLDAGTHELSSRPTSCRFHIRGVDGLFEELDPLGIVKPDERLATMPHGLRQFSVLDPDGNRNQAEPVTQRYSRLGARRSQRTTDSPGAKSCAAQYKGRSTSGMKPGAGERRYALAGRALLSSEPHRASVTRTRSTRMTSTPRPSFAEQKVKADEFLKSHGHGVFATGKRDGSPQQSILGYRFDGTEVVINTGDATVKVKNIRRNPRVSLAVTEGPTCVVVYGEARLLQGAEAEAKVGGPVHSARQGGTPTLIVFSPDTYRWARLDG